MTTIIELGCYKWGNGVLHTMPLADALDKGNVYKSGLHTCRRCLAAKTETCPYVVAIDYTTDGGQTWASDTNAMTGTDALPLPPCPIAQAVADGRTTWRKINKATRMVWRKHWPK